MRLENLLSLRKRIEDMDRISRESHFRRLDSEEIPYYNAISYVFLEGGATEEEIEEFSQKPLREGGTVNGLFIVSLVQEYYSMVGEWLEKAGFDVSQESDLKFLGKLDAICSNPYPAGIQTINGLPLFHAKKKALLDHIDATIANISDGSVDPKAFRQAIIVMSRNMGIPVDMKKMYEIADRIANGSELYSLIEREIEESLGKEGEQK
jgi:hypothetical protein